MKMKKMFAIGMAIAMGTMSLAGCSKTEESDTIKIGASFDLTAGAAQYGKAASNGAQLAIDEYNAQGGVLGKQIAMILEDNKSSQVDATNAFKKLVDKDKIVAFIGSDISSTTETIANIAEERKIPMITPTGTTKSITEVGEHIFRACFIDPDQGEILAQFAAGDLKAKTAAIMVNSESDYSTGIAEVFATTFEAAGGKVATTVNYGKNDVDFKPILANVKTANPDIIIIPDYYETIAIIATQAREIGITAPLLGGDGWDGVTDKVTDNPEVVEGSYFVNHYSPDDESAIVQDFIASYTAKYGAAPNAFAALGYDAARVMIEAIKTADSTDEAKIVEAMKNTDLSCVTGDLTFDEFRNPKKAACIITIKDGKNTFYTRVGAEQ
ncbi:MAG: ABC transporter substrate-binding protein [Cellulosilyticaceae bacterium]